MLDRDETEMFIVKLINLYVNLILSLLQRIINASALPDISRGDACLAEEEWDLAERHYQEAYARVAKGVGREDRGACAIAGQAHIGMGRIFLQTGYDHSAVEAFRTAHRLIPGAWEPLYWFGCALAWSGAMDDAARTFSTALDLAPDQQRIYLQRGQARYHLDALDDALSDYREAERRGGLSAEHRLVLAAIHLERGDHPAAESLLVALSHGPKNRADVLLLLGGALEKQGRWDHAIQAYSRVVQDKSAEKSAIAHERIGLLQLKQQRHSEAWTSFREALRLGRESDPVVFHYGWLCYKRGLFEESVAVLSSLSRRHPERQRLGMMLLRVKYLWGRHLVEEGDVEGAIPLWTDCFSQRPNDAVLAQALAELHFHAAASKSQIEGVAPQDLLEHLEAAHELVPEDMRYRAYLGLIRMVLKDYDGAAGDLEAVCRQSPDDFRCGYFLALCRWHQGGSAQAEAELQRLMRHAYDRSWAARAREALVALYFAESRWSDAVDLLRGCGNVIPTSPEDQPSRRTQEPARNPDRAST